MSEEGVISHPHQTLRTSWKERSGIWNRRPELCNKSVSLFPVTWHPTQNDGKATSGGRSVVVV